MVELPRLCTRMTAGGPCRVILEPDGTCSMHGEAAEVEVERLRALLARCVGENPEDEQERMDVLGG